MVGLPLASAADSDAHRGQMDFMAQDVPDRLRAVVLLALQLGITAFGGPAAHIAMLRDHAVSRRRWLSDQEFLDLMGITNLIPGPNSTEMVMHVGYRRAGWRGLVFAGAAFILPAATITLLFAWAYVRFGATPEGEWILRGIKPIVLAVILQAVWKLGGTAVKNKRLAALGTAVFVLYLLGINEIVLLFGSALVVAGSEWLSKRTSRIGGNPPTVALFPFPLLLGVHTLAQHVDASIPYSGMRLFIGFLKIGAFLYGSGYVLVAFLQNEFVEHLGWITEQQLLDAVAVGQFTPGPVFTTATFVGYLAGGVPGAVIATVGIFLPAFIFVAIIHPFMPRLLGATWIRPLLDGINVAAIGLMAAVPLILARGAIIDPWTALIAIGALVLLVRFNVNSAILIVAGAALSGGWSLLA